MTSLSEARAALERGRHVVLVLPPAPERAAAVWELLPETLGQGPGGESPGPATVVVTSDHAAAVEWDLAAPPERGVHPVTGLTHTARLLKENRIGVLAGAPKDLAALVARSALKLDAVATLVVAWPEPLLATEHGATLDTLLAEARDARRIVLTWNPRGLDEFLERHAHRAPIVGEIPLDGNAQPLPPVGPARYAVVSLGRRGAVLRDVADVLNVRQPFVWAGGAIAPPPEAPDAIFCAVLPTRAELAALSRLGPPVVLVSAGQLPYLRSIAAPLTALPLPTAADRARDRAEQLRAHIAELIGRGDLDAELALLDPLFARFDAAEVAAAVVAISRQPPGAGAAPASPEGPAWVKVFVNVGKKDRAGPKDLVGAMIKEVGLARDQIGRIDARDTFSLVEVAADAAERVVRGLTGVTIKGRRVVARFER